MDAFLNLQYLLCIPLQVSDGTMETGSVPLVTTCTPN